MSTRYVTVSEIQDFLRCRWRWYAKWVLNRVPRRYSDALILGTAVHDILEDHLKGRSLEDAFAEVSWNLASAKHPDPGLAFATAVAHKDLQRYRPQILAWRDLHKVETLAVEEQFELPLHGPVDSLWSFRGRPDRPVLMGGKVWHMQHKTLAGTKSPITYAQFLARSLHETLYGWYCRDHYPYEYGGSIINMIQKRALKDGEDPMRAIHQVPVPLTGWDLDVAHTRLRLIVNDMRREEERGRVHGIWALYDNPQEDAGPFMNSLDGYLPVLRGKASLDDDALFMLREETY